MCHAELAPESLASLEALCVEARSQDHETVRWNWFIYAREARTRLADRGEL